MSRVSPTTRVDAAYARIDELRGTPSDRPRAWITLRNRDEARRDAEAVERRLAEGASAPLAGTVIAVKNNIDVAGLPTTCACPSFAYTPDRSAASVQRLQDAGAVVLGTTNMDQFATGLVGTRSPFGAVRSVADPTLIAGGSSSGSAIVVAQGIVDAALGTDTAGSGRVPAAFNGIVGLKPTRGLIPLLGVVPAAPSFDAVSVLARDVETAVTFAAIMTGPHPEDPTSRPWAEDAPLAAPPEPRIAFPTAEGLASLSLDWRRRYDEVLRDLDRRGARLVEVGISPLLEAATLLYDGPFVAERAAAFGDVVARGAEDIDPAVAAIARSASLPSGADYVRELVRLSQLRLEAKHRLAGTDALLLPTTVRHPSLDEVAADPIGVNTRLGTYTNFLNLLDMAALEVPVPSADGSPFGVTWVVPAFADLVAADLARLIVGGEPGPARERACWGPDGCDLAVFGAHLSGQPLASQLTDLGARLQGDVTTTPHYRLFALETTPPKPGLTRVAGDGASIRGQRWRLPKGRLADFAAQVPPPMTLGRVDLADGQTCLGFLCEPIALRGALDITSFGGWLDYLDHGPETHHTER